MIDNRPLSEQYLEIATEWCDAESAADLLESTKSSVLAQRMLSLGDMAVNKAETLVKGTDEWVEYLEKINKARTRANHLKVKVEYMRMKFQEWSSQEANNRAQARL